MGAGGFTDVIWTWSPRVLVLVWLTRNEMGTIVYLDTNGA